MAIATKKKSKKKKKKGGSGGASSGGSGAGGGSPPGGSGPPGNPRPRGVPKYGVVPGARIRKRDARPIGQVIVTLEQAHGQVTAEMVVSHAQSNNSPFHRYMEWDDTEAARQHRLSQARYILRSIEVIYANRPPIRLNAHIQYGQIDGYVTQARVLSHAQMRQLRLDQALNDLTSWVETYEDLFSWLGIRTAMRSLLARFRARRTPKSNGRTSRI